MLGEHGFTEADCKIGRSRRKDEVYPYASGRGEDLLVHEVKEMLFYRTHMDRVLWAIKTTQGRVIVVMQQVDRLLDHQPVLDEIELSNAPFPSTAAKIIDEDLIDFRALYDVLKQTRSL